MQQKQNKFYTRLIAIFFVFLPSTSFSFDGDTFTLFICDKTVELHRNFEKILLVNCTSGDTTAFEVIPTKINGLNLYDDYKLLFYDKRNIYEIPFQLPWQENQLIGIPILLKLCFTPAKHKKRNLRVTDIDLYDGISGRSMFSNLIRR